MYYIIVEHVHDLVLSDVKTGEFLALDVSITEFSDETDGVETGVLSKGIWDKFEAFSVLSYAVRVDTEDLSGVGLELLAYFHFDASTTWNKGSLLD